MMIVDDPYTVWRRPPRESAQGFYDVVMDEIGREEARSALVEQMLA